MSGPEPHFLRRTVAGFVTGIDAHLCLADGHVAEGFAHLCSGEGGIKGRLHIVEGNDIVELTLQGLSAEGGGGHGEDHFEVGRRRRVVGYRQCGGSRGGIDFGTLSGNVKASELLTAGELALQRGGCRGDIHFVECVEGFGAGRPIEFAGGGVEGGGLRITRLDAGVADDRLAAVLLVDEEQASGAVDTVHLAGGVGGDGKERTAEVADGTDATVLGAEDAEKIAVEVVVEEASVDLAAHGIVGEVGGDARQLHTVGAQAAPVFGVVDIVIGKDASHAGVEEIDETVFVVDEHTAGIGVERVVASHLPDGRSGSCGEGIDAVRGVVAPSAASDQATIDECAGLIASHVLRTLCGETEGVLPCGIQCGLTIADGRENTPETFGTFGSIGLGSRLLFRTDAQTFLGECRQTAALHQQHAEHAEAEFSDVHKLQYLSIYIFQV